LNAGRGADLVATAEVIQRGRSISVCEVTVRGGETAVARAVVTYKLSGGK
jgi:acyl-coenzyme A thioesterase PaaI-like protein